MEKTRKLIMVVEIRHSEYEFGEWGRIELNKI